jgi:hypothetical protein
MATLPPDNRAVGTPDPAGDNNSIVDCLSTITGAAAGGGTVTAQQTLDTLAGAVTSGQVLRGNGTHVQLAALQAGDIPALAYAGQLTPTGTKTANYTAAAGDLVPCDTSGGAFTVTLPTGPAGLSLAAVLIINGTNTVTVAAGGTDVFDKAAGPASITLYPGAGPGPAAVSLQYRTSGNIWYRQSGYNPSAVTTLGDLSYGGTGGAPARLAGNTAAVTKVLAQTGTGSVSAAPVWVQQNYNGIFGDASDGAVNFDGTTTVLGLVPSTGVYTLTRDIFCTSLQVGGGGTATTIIANGWRIFCQGTATIAANGTISAAGNAAATLSNNHGAGGATSTGSLGGGRPGSAGVATGAASSGTVSAGVATGAPGAGGNGSTGTGGASAGAAPGSGSSWLRLPHPVLSTALFNSSAVQRVDGGGGGSGGGGDGTNFGGGGGGGGGVVAILAWALVNNGTLTANGGAGGTPTTVATNGGVGGGGGGAAGLVLTYTLSAPTGSGTTTVTGGTGGTKATNGSGTAANGGNGANGVALNIVLA